MLRIDRILKPWKESGSLNAQINLYGFWNDEVFLTKSGDLGIVLRVRGVDYESLDQAAQEYAVKRLEAALKIFGPGFHVYQYLFKTNRPHIPFESSDDPVVQAAIDQRQEFFSHKLDQLFAVEIFYAIVIEGTRSKTGVAAALAQLPTDPRAGLRELKAQFSSDKLKVLLREQIEADLLRLEQRSRSFMRQLADFVHIEPLQRGDCFRFLRRLLNYDGWRIDGRQESGQFLDYQVANSNIEAERDHLRVGDHFVRVLTMKEAITETKPLVLKQLLEIQANFCVVTEWMPMESSLARKEITKRKRHFNVSKSSFISSMQRDPESYDPRNVIIDESKQADIENLGDCLRAIGEGQTLGDFSLTVVLYAEDKKALDRTLPEVVRIFTSADGSLFSETYNQLNAYFAIVPGNYRQNLRRLYLLNSNYADLSFLFTILPGETWNDHLAAEYLAVLETEHHTPYYLNLHNRDVAHTLILGATGSGKTTALDVLRIAAEGKGYAVEGVAPTSRAAKQLSDAGISAGTLQAFLARGQNVEPQADQERLYFVDESSLTSTSQMKEFLNRLKPLDRVVLVGDIRQHQAIEAGRPFEQLQDAGMSTAKLDQIVRQKEPELKAAVECLARGDVSEGIRALRTQGRIREIADSAERVRAIARDFAENPANTLVVSPDNTSRRELNDAIRTELQSKGTVVGENHPLKILVQQQDLTGADRRWAARYVVNDQLRYSRGSNSIGIQRGGYARVVSTNLQDNLLTVETKTGGLVTYDPRRLTGVSIYREIEQPFAVGDRLQFTAPDKRLGVANRELGTIEQISAEGNLAIRLEKGRTVEVNPLENRHFDHGYAVTSHSAQGLTADRVLINVDTSAHPDLVNSRFAYVAVSRARNDAQIFTNDGTSLDCTLGKNVSKSAAIDFSQKIDCTRPNCAPAPEHTESVTDGIRSTGARHDLVGL